MTYKFKRVREKEITKKLKEKVVILHKATQYVLDDSYDIIRVKTTGPIYNTRPTWFGLGKETYEIYPQITSAIKFADNGAYQIRPFWAKNQSVDFVKIDGQWYLT